MISRSPHRSSESPNNSQRSPNNHFASFVDFCIMLILLYSSIQYDIAFQLRHYMKSTRGLSNSSAERQVPQQRSV